MDLSLPIIVIFFLSLLLIVAGVWINTLLNKLMSRNYYDYVVTKNHESHKVPESEPKVKTHNPEDFEDLGYLS